MHGVFRGDLRGVLQVSKCASALDFGGERMDPGLVQLDQGSGGRAMHELIDALFLSAFEKY